MINIKTNFIRWLIKWWVKKKYKVDISVDDLDMEVTEYSANKTEYVRIGLTTTINAKKDDVKGLLER